MGTRSKDNDPRIPFMMRALNASSHAYKLAGLLCWKYGNKDGAIFPAQETLAADLGIMERTVRTLIKDELVPIGLKVDIRRGPRTGNKVSFYSFGEPDPQLVIPEIRNLNTRRNSGSQTPKSDPNLGVSAQLFRCPDDNNSGSQTPPNQKIDPIEGSKRESAQARASLSEPAFDSHSEVKDGEILPPENGPGRHQGKPAPLPPDWQPSDEDWDYASQQGLVAEDIDNETQRFRDWTAENGKVSRDWSASWRRFVGNSRLHKRNWRGTRGDRAREMAREAEAIEAIMVAAGFDRTDQAAYRRFEAEWKAGDGTDAAFAALMAKAAATNQGREGRNGPRS